VPRFVVPPGWPYPPPGWAPPPNWQPDPSWPAPPAGWQFWVEDHSPPPVQPRSSRWKQDDDLAASLVTVPNWPLRVGAWPVAAVVAVIVISLALNAVWTPPHSVRLVVAATAQITGTGIWAATAVTVGRPIARAMGGWRPAFGWSRPRWTDVPLGLAWAVGGYLVRLILVVIVVALVPTLRGVSGSNVNLDGLSAAGITFLAIAAVIIAPPIEELIFRGLVLRTLLRRMTFWPAALISTVVFAGLHVYEVDGVRAGAILFVSIFAFGLGQCLLVRWTGRLAPAIAAHAAANAISLVLTLTINR
jgi:membrane protease YdiL (CAAX protease family)